jgi:hypothetical protein
VLLIAIMLVVALSLIELPGRPPAKQKTAHRAS